MTNPTAAIAPGATVIVSSYFMGTERATFVRPVGPELAVVRLADDRLRRAGQEVEIDAARVTPA